MVLHGDRVIAAAPDWTPVSRSIAGFDDQLDARLDALIAQKRAPGLHGIVVTRGGKLVLERYFEGDDESWGTPLKHVKFGPDTLHDLRSVTKSVVGLLYGIALAEGRVPPPEAPVMEAFPEYLDLAPERAGLTLAHVLTMTMGTEWDESSVPYSDPANSEIAMEAAPDRYRFILERKVIDAPGKRWTYCGGATALLGHLIAKGTGMRLPDYARARLFAPLGIASTQWIAGRDGVPSAASGLRMTVRDVTRIGQLLLARGEWQGQDLIPASWIEECMQPRVNADEVRRYGYHWYSGYFSIAPRAEAPRKQPRLELWWGAFGNGGQRLFVLPDLDLTIAITAGNYSAPDQWIAPIRVVREVILPSLL